MRAIFIRYLEAGVRGMVEAGPALIILLILFPGAMSVDVDASAGKIILLIVATAAFHIVRGILGHIYSLVRPKLVGQKPEAEIQAAS